MKQQETMLGESHALTEALDHLSQLAAIHRPVLILGERGTGKELAAERLHYLSARWDGAFIKVNCAAMAETLLESELFGHEAGAFTGASRQHIGRFERADGGTLLLDEIGTMSPRLQEKLLRLIEYGEFERVGGQRTIAVDVRVIGATNADLQAMAQTQAFRADLLDRLSFDCVHMPALRHRGDDTLLLARHFAVQMSAELDWPLFPGFSEEASQRLRTYAWPGNVRELKNVVERSLHRWGDPDVPIDNVILNPFHNPWADDDQQTTSAGGPRKVPTAPDTDPRPGASQAAQTTLSAAPAAGETFDLRAAVNEYEKRLLRATLDANGFNQRRSADSAGLSYDQLRGLLKKHDLKKPKRRPRQGT